MVEAGITDWVDFVIIGIYFVFVIGVGLLSIFRKNRESVQGYFLAGRSMTWLPIGASLFASNIGSEHFVGLAGSGAASGIGVVSFEWGAVLLLMLLGWVFLPIYLSAGVFTMPEYLGRRFGGTRMRIYLSLVALALYVTTKVSVDMYAGMFFIQLATGWDMYLAMIGLLVVTALYTIVGGLAAVVFTDTLQTVVMLVGAVALAIMAFVEVGGMTGLYVKYMEAIAEPLLASTVVIASNANLTTTTTAITTSSLSTTTSSIATSTPSSTINQFYSFDNATDHIIAGNGTCGRPRADAFHMFRDPVNSDLPWPGVIFRATFASLWNWCADQVIVQRALAARNMAHARGATVLAGYLKFTPLFLIIFPGMISRVLYTDEIACTTKESCKLACGNEAGCSNSAYPYLILRLAPVGMKGLLMAVMVAALMSSLTSIFNSAVTVFTMDLWRRARPNAKEKELLIVGRLFVIVLVGVSIAWIPLIMESQGGQLFMYIQAVTGYIAPPISAIFLLAILIPRINEKGAFFGVISGQIVGIIRLVLDFVYPSPSCGHEDDRPFIVAKVHFTYFSAIVFGVTAIVALGVSLMTQPQDKRDITNLTFWTLQKQQRVQKDSKTKTKQNRRPKDGSLGAQCKENAQNKLPDDSSSGVVMRDRPYLTSDESASGTTTSDWRNSKVLEEDSMGNDYSQWKHAFRRFRDTSLYIAKSRESLEGLPQVNPEDPSKQGASARAGFYELGDKTYAHIIRPQAEAMDDLDLDKDSADTPAVKVAIQADPDQVKVLDKFQNLSATFKSYVDQPWAALLNFNAILLLSVLSFLCGYFH